MRRHKAILLLLLICCCKISAQESDIISSIGPLDQQELLTFVDQWVAKNQKASGTPAISISMVQNGQIQISKGYGVTNLVNAKVVDKNSVFRIASVSKVFVGIAAAQLAEKGQLDMDRDINDYLTSEA